MKKITSLILFFALILSLSLSLSSCGGCEKRGTGACEYLDKRSTEGHELHYVEMCVDGYGQIVILLDATTAPVTVENFLKLVNEGFYDGLTFHRIIEGFMIQGGDPDADGTGGSKDTIKGEFAVNGYQNDISHKKGVISMARGNAYDSASSQFFICNDDAGSSLDGSYAAFGYVVEGLDIIDSITEDTMKSVLSELGQNNFYYWLYYGNGMLTEDFGIEKLQPKIKHIRVLDSWEK